MARTHGHGNPKWTRDETILALDLYFDCGGSIPTRNDPRVMKLSAILQHLPYHDRATRRESFRNPDGVAFKLQNLRSVETGKGLKNVSRMDREIWAELGSDRERTKKVAELIRRDLAFAKSLGSEPTEDDDEFFEGRIVTQIHKRRERNPNLRKRLLATRRGIGQLTCDMCGNYSKSRITTFEDAAFEAHHLVPVAMVAERKTRLVDLALLCAGCHRLVHRAIAVEKRWLSIGEARGVLGITSGS